MSGLSDSLFDLYSDSNKIPGLERTWIFAFRDYRLVETYDLIIHYEGV